MSRREFPRKPLTNQISFGAERPPGRSIDKIPGYLPGSRELAPASVLPEGGEEMSRSGGRDGDITAQ
jgi:hypothetical protein